MKTKVLHFRDAVSLINLKLKLLSFVINSPNVLDTLIPVGRLFHSEGYSTTRHCYKRNFYEHNRYEVTEVSIS